MAKHNPLITEEPKEPTIVEPTAEEIEAREAKERERLEDEERKARELNPLLPVVDSEAWDHIVLVSAVIPDGGILHVERPKRREDPQIRFLTRQLARKQGVNPDDMDMLTHDAFYTAAFFQMQARTPAKLNWLELEPENRKEADALYAIERRVFRWLAQFQD